MIDIIDVGSCFQEHLFFINIIGDNGDRGLDNHLFDLLEGAIKNWEEHEEEARNHYNFWNWTKELATHVIFIIYQIPFFRL